MTSPITLDPEARAATYERVCGDLARLELEPAEAKHLHELIERRLTHDDAKPGIIRRTRVSGQACAGAALAGLRA